MIETGPMQEAKVTALATYLNFNMCRDGCCKRLDLELRRKTRRISSLHTNLQAGKI
jgi:hypothetical protein